MLTPIIVFHYGYAPHLVKVLAQAKAFNPSSEIILLGDESNRFLNFVRHENIRQYFQEATRFEQ